MGKHSMLPDILGSLRSIARGMMGKEKTQSSVLLFWTLCAA